ncbi:serine/threonine-protein kinase [Actinomadura sp. WMMB 499]|uniref:serine/threonine-protein kinase n=1 Tax=Actinomadura sp. WMMB 499 TaxID=1219491 RepID=UPI0012464253|nr:serine/threonine-protein kinase [Actinomadura sp. WMMB 499]QFG22614.1 serine/threonine protein kinase [Actinomadura sp. WMMB 499]
MAGAGLKALRPGDPRRIGPYRLLARLGAGGMGQVYLGGSRGHRRVAVKVVHPHFADDATFRRRFAKEVAAARRVGGYYTAQVVDADTDADPPWLVTEYIAGPSLQDAVDRNGPLPEASVAALGAGLAEGLDAIHRQHVLHRDLKPGNVLLAQDGPRIIDFGIARAMDAPSQSMSLMGTPGYMSPEQYVGRDIGPKSDVFCLAAVLAYAATGRHPFGEGPPDALGYRVRHEEPDLSGVPAALRPLIADGLAKDPDDRPTVAGFLERCPAPSTGTGTGMPMPEAFTTLINTRVAETESFDGGPSGAGERRPPRPPRPPQPPRPPRDRAGGAGRPPARPPNRPATGPSAAVKRAAGPAAAVGVLLIALLVALSDRDASGGSGNAGSSASTASPSSTRTSEGTSGTSGGLGSTRRPSPSPTPDRTYEAFDDISVGDCLDAYRDPYDSDDWSESMPSSVSCGRDDAYLKVYAIRDRSSECDAESLDAESWWRSPAHDGDRIYLCVRRQFQKGDCFLGKEGSEEGRVSVNGHGLMTSWGCGKDTVPRDFDYILQYTGYYESRCPSGSRRWTDFRKGVLCARIV